MKIIISPAKKMNEDTDSLPYESLPEFLQEAEALKACLQGMSPQELQALWKCNDSIAALNRERLQKMDLHRRLTPAILAYEGIQYQYMAPGIFEEEQLKYIRQHLRILSGFYGLLRPFDGVTPYRLEMQSKLTVGSSKNLYDFWGSRLADKLAEENDFILNLASKEYSKAVTVHLPKEVQVISCVFGEEKEGKIIEKGTMCKMARGEMVRFLAERNITEPKQIKTFDRLGYTYSEQYSTSAQYVFIKGEETSCWK